MHGDGSQPTGKVWNKLNEMDFMKDMRNLDLEDEIY
jgi:hypothetical protein